MKTRFVLAVFACLILVELSSCSSFKEPGKRIKGPYTSSDYQTSNRFFRGTGEGESTNREISREKAMLSAKKMLASSVQTTMKNVTDRFLNERAVANGSEYSEKFETLTREVVNQMITDIRLMDEKAYQLQNGHFLTYVALEVKKKTLYKKMKEAAQLKAFSDESVRNRLLEMLEKASSESED